MRKGTCVIVLMILLLAAGCGGGGSNSGSNETTVTLGEQNGSGESGTATLTKEGDKTKVVVDLQGASSMTAAQPAHIHKGTCAKLNPVPEYPLSNVQSGKSTTTVNESLDELKKEAYAINVHKSAADLKTYVACGDIGSGKSSGATGGGY
jgi:CHRD domain-containing protein